MRVIFFCLLMLLTAVPATAQDATGTITTQNTAIQDLAIATRMREIMAELGDYGDVMVTVNEGVVTLRGTTTSMVEALALQPLASRIEGVVAVRNEVTETTDIARRLNPAVTRFTARLEQFIVFLPLALIAGLAFGLVVLLGFAIARMKQPWERLAPNTFVAEIYRQLLRVLFIVIGMVIALDIVNATALLSTILGAAGIIGLAFGFAVRETVENFIASVMLSFRQPFRPNDTIEINGEQGKVIRLTSRATILLSFDGNHIRIPNATVFKSRIINFSTNAERRFRFEIMVDRDADLRATLTLVNQTVQALPFVLADPKAQTWIEALQPRGVDLIVTGWIDQNATSLAMARGEALRQVKLAIDTAGAVMPDIGQTLTPVSDTPKAVTLPSETTQVTHVDADQDAALTRIVEAERQLDSAEDLLRPDSPKE
ncbi:MULTISPECIES: mechanosensitive ion channel domain-containing protein [unclassified Yoonia]|uniref:mechanosensitive ion channel domain-containing protein n=1 Tax=unclassified Yoonia TaxID=2629118 RepID=UPI002AFF31A9|nr:MULTISPECIES: mechanosensitive ion channel domain-containing protein [unclassified Yoonia]